MEISKISTRRFMRLKKRRKFWLKVHLYLGLWAGALLLVIGLTGSILSFWLEIDRWLNPDLMTVYVLPQANMRPLQEIVAVANVAMPANAEFSYAYASHSPEDASYFFYDVPIDEAGNYHTINVFVNPYTTEIMGTRLFYHATNLLGYCFIGFIFKLHYSLLSGDAGMLIVGILGVFFFISVLAGFILWWPLTGEWLKAVTIKSKASTERFNYDIHKTFGFYSSLILLAVLVSGISMNLPDQFTWLVETFPPASSTEDYKTQPQVNKSAVTVDQARQAAQRLYPDSELYWFSVPKLETDVYVFTLHGVLGKGVHGRQTVVIDRYGKVLLAFDPLSGVGGNVFMQWMWSLHSGQVLGMPGRILVLLSGIACAVLFITGIIRWLQKRKASRLRKIKHSKPTAT